MKLATERMMWDFQFFLVVFRCGGEMNIWGFIDGTASFWGVDKIYFNDAWFPPDKEISFPNMSLYLRYFMTGSGNAGGASVRCLKSN